MLCLENVVVVIPLQERVAIVVPDDLLRRYTERTEREFVVVYQYRPSPPVVRRSSRLDRSL